MKNIGLLIILIALISCNSKRSDQHSTKKVEDTLIEIVKEKQQEISEKKSVKPVEKQIQFQDDSLLLDESLGILTIDNYSAKKILIYNEDETIFDSIIFQAESQEYYRYLDSMVSQFKMHAFKPDYNLFKFKANIQANYFEIQTKTGKTKLIPIETEYCSFATWTELLMSGDYVSISDKNFDNTFKIHQAPEDSSVFIQKEFHDYLIKAKEMQNEWIKIQGESLINDSIRQIGWIKWRNEDRMLIDFYYLL